MKTATTPPSCTYILLVQQDYVRPCMIMHGYKVWYICACTPWSGGKAQDSIRSSHYGMSIIRARARKHFSAWQCPLPSRHCPLNTNCWTGWFTILNVHVCMCICCGCWRSGLPCSQSQHILYVGASTNIYNYIEIPAEFSAVRRTSTVNVCVCVCKPAAGTTCQLIGLSATSNSNNIMHIHLCGWLTGCGYVPCGK